MSDPVIGQWVSDAPRVALEPRFLEESAELGIIVQAVMVDSSKSPWDPRWKPSELEQFARRAIDLDLEVVLTTWPCPQREVLGAMGRDMAELLKVGAVAWESDAEGLWVEDMVRGFVDLEEASRFYLDMQRSICDPLDVRIELTTHPWHDEGFWTTRELERWLRLDEEARLGDLGPNVDRIVWQAYSTNRTPSGVPVAFYDPRLGPGGMQRFTLGRAQGVPGVVEGHPRLCAGLAAYRQSFPGHTPREAMKRAYQEALMYRPFEVRYWDSLRIVGARRNGYSAEFIRSIRGAP